MKILLINITAASGSVGKIVENLYWGVIAKDMECKVAYGRGTTGGIPVKDTYRIESKVGLYSHAFLSRVRGKSGFYSKYATRKLIQWIDSYKPDIIHVHSLYGYYINMELLFNYIEANNIRLISTLHSCWDFTGHCCYFDYPKCDNWKTGCNDCIRLNDYPECWIKEDTHKNYKKKQRLYESIRDTTIVTPSRWLAMLAGQSFLRNKKIICIHNGIDLNVFKPGGRSKMERPTVLCVANVWSKRKGLEDVCEFATFVGDSVDIIVVGLSEKQIRKLPDNIQGIERTESISELVQLYQKATILFNPTYEENYPTVNIEAVACHLPVATYDTGGCRETIKEGEYGRIVAKKDYGEVYRFLMEVFEEKIKYDYSNLSYLDSGEMVSAYCSLYFEEET